MTKSYFISSAHALILKLHPSLSSFCNDVTSKLLYIDESTGYRATKQIQAKIDGLRTGYGRATIKVAHFVKTIWKYDKVSFSIYYACVR